MSIVHQERRYQESNRVCFTHQQSSIVPQGVLDPPYSRGHAELLFKAAIPDLLRHLHDRGIPPPSHDRYELVYALTGHMLRPQPSSNPPNPNPSGNEATVDQLLNFHNGSIYRSEVKAMTKSALKSFLRELGCSASGTVDALRQDIYRVASWTKKKAENSCQTFCGDVGDFADSFRRKEEVMGEPVLLYKTFFNLQDRIDHLISDIDPSVRHKDKEARRIEGLLLVALVNSYTLNTELRMRKKFSNRMHARAEDATSVFPSKDFLREVMNELLSTTINT